MFTNAIQPAHLKEGAICDSLVAALLQGEREVNDIIKFLAREATDPLRGYDRDGNKKAKKKKKPDNIEL